MTSESSSRAVSALLRDAQASLAADRHEEARKTFEQALALADSASERADALLGIGIACAGWAHRHEYHSWTPPASRIGLQQPAKLRQFEAARTALEGVLALPELTPEREAKAHFHLASVLYQRGEYARAVEELRAALNLEGMPSGLRTNTQLLLGYYLRHGGRGDAVAAYGQVLTSPDATPAQQGDARMAIADILRDRRDFAGAHRELEAALAIPDLPAVSRASVLLARGRLFLLEDNPDEARAALTQALVLGETPGGQDDHPLLFAGGPTGRGTMPQAGSDLAGAQLLLGILEAREGNGSALRKVTDMAGASYGQIHDAELHLHLKKLAAEGEKAVTVLFIGSSHTQVRNVPQLVEQLALSAPADHSRVLAGSCLFGGHFPKKLWDLGDGPGTPRRAIAQDPWDYLVVEGPFSRDYTERFVERTRAGNIRAVLYETPVSAKVPYPDGFTKSRAESLAMARELGMILAPVSHAWRLYLGENPSEELRLSLYHADGVHTATKGAYLAACTLYAAITDRSPVDLAHDMASLAWTDGTGVLLPEDARALQEAAWKAVQDTAGEKR